MRRTLVMLAATTLLMLWPMASAGGVQATGSAPQAVPEDFNGDSFPDLAVGAPEETIGEDEAAGVVHVLYGSPGGGLSAAGSQLWSQDSPGVAGVAEPADRFADALGAGTLTSEGG